MGCADQVTARVLRTDLLNREKKTCTEPGQRLGPNRLCMGSTVLGEHQTFLPDTVQHQVHPRHHGRRLGVGSGRGGWGVSSPRRDLGNDRLTVKICIYLATAAMGGLCSDIILFMWR